MNKGKMWDEAIANAGLRRVRLLIKEARAYPKAVADFERRSAREILRDLADFLEIFLPKGAK
jgi:hypothetical protein